MVIYLTIFTIKNKPEIVFSKDDQKGYWIRVRVRVGVIHWGIDCNMYICISMVTYILILIKLF